MKLSWRKFFSVAILISFVLSLPGLAVRWKMETSRRSSVILVDWRQIPLLALQGDVNPAGALKRLMDHGVRGIMVGEITGSELGSGVLPVWYGPLEDLPASLRYKLPKEMTGTALAFPAKGRRYELWDHFLGLRFPKGKSVVVEDQRVFVIPQTREQLNLIGILPDLQGLDVAAELSLPVVYRPAPRGVDPSETAIRTVGFICDKYPGVVGLAPSGEVVAGYPDLAGLSDLVKARNLFVAQVEFSRQIGDKPLQWSVWPRVLSLHSVTDEEIMARRIDRTTMLERMVRAGVERSVSLLLFRIDPLGGGNDLLERYSSDIAELRQRLAQRNIDDRWPICMSDWGWSPTGALALSLIALVCGVSFYRRISGSSNDFSVKLVLVIVLATVGLALGLLRVGPLTRLIGAVAAALVVTEGALTSLDSWKKPGKALIQGPLIAVVGGLAIASFYGIPLYMMRLNTFSGVKLTLFLPLLLVFLHDIHRRVHPESLREVLCRPPLWGELFIAGFLVLGAAFMIYRSGNVSSVPGWELKVRDALESLLVARPRTKEAFLGYPCLVLWFIVRRNDWIPRYREVLRLGAVVAFGSMVNTFCHFHTDLYITLWRVFNGWWIGILVGIAAVLALRLAVMPLGRRIWGTGSE